jgi:hypothetical protein
MHVCEERARLVSAEGEHREVARHRSRLGAKPPDDAAATGEGSHDDGQCSGAM